MQQTFFRKVGTSWNTLVFIMIWIGLNYQPGDAQVPVAEKSILVEADEEGQLYYQWYSSCGIPYMRVAIWLGLQDSDLRKHNQIAAHESFRKAKTIRMPVTKNKLFFSREPHQDSQAPLQVWYRVKKGETLYRIARSYAGCSMATLMQINKKVQWEIHEGEKLLLGMIAPIEKESNSGSNRVNTPADHKENVPEIPVKERVEPSAAPEAVDQREEPRWVEEEVIGGKVKNDLNSKSFFVLHNSAVQGSSISIFNPMLRRAITAKVLGPIPAGTYKDEIQIILSAAAARELGIIDFRFKVKVRYELPAPLE